LRATKDLRTQVIEKEIISDKRPSNAPQLFPLLFLQASMMENRITQQCPIHRELEEEYRSRLTALAAVLYRFESELCWHARMKLSHTFPIVTIGAVLTNIIHSLVFEVTIPGQDELHRCAKCSSTYLSSGLRERSPRSRRS